MITNVIFDVDGTLVDSVDFHAESWKRSLAEFGKEVELKAVRDQIGKGGDMLMKEFLSESELAELGDKIEEFRKELFKKEYLMRVQPFPEARTLAARLVADGKKIVLASSAPQTELDHYKEILGIEDFLTGETNVDDVEKSKPAPDIFAVALEELGNPAKDTVIVIGDSPYDAMAASKIDLQTIGVLSGGFDEEWLRREGCVEIYKNTADLLANYENSALCCKDQIKTKTLSDMVGALLV